MFDCYFVIAASGHGRVLMCHINERAKARERVASRKQFLYREYMWLHHKPVHTNG
jgi:hypothetical protein